MKTRVKIWALGASLVCLAAGSGYAQEQPASSSAPLGDIARQVKAQKVKEHKPAKVLTNDTIASSEDPGFGTAPSKKPSGQTAPDESKPDKSHGAEYFRSEQGKIQDRLDIHKRELSVLQQKLGQNQTQFYPNPQDSLMQQYSRGDIDKLTAEINAKKQQIDNDQKAMDDLQEQLRREGGDPSWLRQ